MKLQELVPKETELLSLDVSVLAEKLLVCLSDSTRSSSVRRRGLASRLLMGYPCEFGRESQLAIEEALMWLEHEMMIGIDPDEREFVFVTRKGRDKIGTMAVLV